jgi:site-specific recombinase XerD
MIVKSILPVSRRMFSPVPVTVVESNEELIEQYLEWKKCHAPVAAEKYAIWVRRFQAMINKAPEAFTVGDWTAFAKSLEGRFAPKTIQFALCIVHNYLRFWHEQGRLRSLPLYFARIPKAIANSHNAISEDEYRLIVENLREKGNDALRDLALVMLLHDSGMRVGEIVQLEFDQIEEGASAVIRTEKTVQCRRIFWNAETDNVLQRLIVQRVNSGTQSDWLFVGCGKGTRESRGGHLSPKTVQRAMKRAVQEVRIERKLSPHSFRHAFIHRLAKMGVPDALIAQAVGHGSPHSISHYTKLSRPELEEIARRQFRELATAA